MNNINEEQNKKRKKLTIIISLIAVFIYIMIVTGLPNKIINSIREEKLLENEINRYLVISNQNKGTIPMIQNGKYTYFIEFKLENKSDYDLKIKGNAKITVNGKSEKKEFQESINANKTIIVKVVILSPEDSKNFTIDYIDIFEAIYKK